MGFYKLCRKPRHSRRAGQGQRRGQHCGLRDRNNQSGAAQIRFAFERFLNEERVSMPDFDVDFCFERRGEVIDYVVRKYGASNVSQIITFGTLAMKAAIKDVARVYGEPYSLADRITKLIGAVDKKAKLLDLVGQGNDDYVIPELKAMYDNEPAVKRIIDMAMRIEGMPRQTGMHAAGVVICKDPISDHVPLQMSGTDVTTQFDMQEVEKLGLLKMDFWGLGL